MPICFVDLQLRDIRVMWSEKGLTLGLYDVISGFSKICSTEIYQLFYSRSELKLTKQNFESRLTSGVL
jgi:hypothetical protein